MLRHKFFLVLLLLIHGIIESKAQQWFEELCHAENGKVCWNITCLNEHIGSTSCLFLENQYRPELPSKMNNCIELQYIHIEYCSYGKIPEQIYDCPNLTYLTYSDSNAFISDKIFRCSNLKSFGIAGSGIKSLPKSLSKLKKLEFIWLEANKIKRIPRVLYQIKSLKIVDLSRNPISEKEINKFRKRRPNVELIFEPYPIIVE
jgi:Leucine-rich repeat (LRR) protein